MFFDMDLLCRQRRGKFALIWLAATRGITAVRNIEVQKVSIKHVCDEILKYVMSKSTSPRQRFSLYLSAKLLYGTVLVYQLQVKNCENQVKQLTIQVKRPVFKFEMIGDDDDDDVNVKRKRKRVKKPAKPKKGVTENQDQQLLPLQTLEEQMLRTFPDVTANVTDAIHITLRDEVSTRININEQDLFGDEGQIDQQLAQLKTIDWTGIPVPESVPIPVPTTTDKAATPSQKRRVSAVEDVNYSPSKRRIPETSHIVPITRIQEHGSLSPVVADRDLMPPPATPRTAVSVSTRSHKDRPTELTNAEIRENIQRSLLSPVPEPRPRTARRRLSLEYSVLTPTRWRRDQIHRVNAFDMGRRSLSREGSETSLDNSLARQQDPKDIIAEMLCGVQFSEEDIISVVRDIQEDLSLDSAVQRLRRSSELHTRTAEAEPAVPTEASVRAIMPAPLEPVPEVPLLPSPRLSRIPMEIEPIPEPQSVKHIEVSEVRKPVPRVHTSTPVTFDTEAKRHNALLQYIRELFSSNGNQPLNMKHLCNPMTRLQLARTFHGLLCLHDQQYIVMTTFPNSLEFKEIYPGKYI